MKQIQLEQEKLAKLEEKFEHLQGLEVELFRKQEIISSSAEQVRVIIVGLKKEIALLAVQGENNPLNKLKEDILTESLICESKRREVA